MANRRRGTFSLPDELRTTARLSTKKEMAQHRKSLPRCPTPVINKVRRAFAGYMEKPKAIYFKKPVTLEPDYDSDSEMTYFAQIFSSYAPIGEGSFGRVFRARTRKEEEVYAIKRIKSCVSYTDRYSEIHNYEKLGEHANIVQYFMSWEENSELYMKLEFCDISVADLSLFCHDFPEDFLWSVLYDICKALNFLHKQNYIHLDVKPSNIMIKNGYFKLADFGIMADLKREPLVIKTVSDGDSKYLAIEVLEGVYKPSCDIFGLGLTLLELASDLELPSYGVLWHQLRKLILPLTFYQKYSLGFKILVERMLQPEYAARPSAEKILKYTTVKAIEKKDRKKTRVNYFEVIRDSLDNEEDVELLMRCTGIDHHFNADVENNNVNNNNNENNNIVCTPPCAPRHSFVDYPEYPSLLRCAAPKPCRSFIPGKSLHFDEMESPQELKTRRSSRLKNNCSEDSDNLIEVDSNFLDEEEKENCDATMEVAPDYNSPHLRLPRYKLSRTKLTFD